MAVSWCLRLAISYSLMLSISREIAVAGWSYEYLVATEWKNENRGRILKTSMVFINMLNTYTFAAVKIRLPSRQVAFLLSWEIYLFRATTFTSMACPLLSSFLQVISSRFLKRRYSTHVNRKNNRFPNFGSYEYVQNEYPKRILCRTGYRK